MFRDFICRWLHRQSWPYNREGITYQQCFDCGRELVSKIQLSGRVPCSPYTEREMTAIEKHFKAEARRNAFHLSKDLAELERTK